MNVHEDNGGAIHLAWNHGRSTLSKHTDLRYYFIQNEVRMGRTVITHTRSKNQCADGYHGQATVVPQEAFVKNSRYISGIRMCGWAVVKGVIRECVNYR